MGLSLLCFFAFMHLVSSLLLFHLTFAHITSSIHPVCHDNERSALLQFKQSLVINQSVYVSFDPSAYPKVASWNLDEENSNCCSWDGIECDEDTGHVIKLNLTSSFLYGPINSSNSLFHLVHLQWLILADNGLQGTTLSSIGNLTKLVHLDISCNIFVGLNSNSLYWITNLKELTTLNLAYINLTGEIPSFFMNLTQLTELTLSYNRLTGPIPSWLMNLNKLTKLYLGYNCLTGHIPVEISNLTKLQELSFGSNSLEGSIPSSIFDLKNLRVLALFSNNLSGTVDINMLFLNLKSLYGLVLSSNNLSLLTTTAVNTTLQKFIYIGFGSCNLSEFPYFLHNQDQLMSLDLSSNNIAGQVPGWLLNVGTNNLVYLNLSYNLLTGFDHNPPVLPWTELVTLDLRYNKLQGPLPVPSMSTSSYLVSNNQLTGEIPPRICSLNRLYALDLSYNNLSGMLPECLGSFSRELSLLKLQGNNFHGSIPQTFMKGSNLRMIDLSNNSLQGRIPQSLANCPNLKFLNLGNNEITDIFPFWLGTLPMLEVLILKFNRFYGEIKEPETDIEFPKLRIVDLSHNGFTGNLPSKYFRCWNAMKNTNANKLTYLQDSLFPNSFIFFTNYGDSDYSLMLSNKGTEMEYRKLSNLITAVILSNNKFMGEIPTSIANLKGLRTLNLSNNNLEGHIPSSLVDLTVLESLDLSNNKLSGEIPQQLAELTALASLDVSHNNLKGPIPLGTQFTTFNSSSFEGNPGLCGEPLLKKCGNSEASQEEDKRSESLFEFGWKIVLIGYASGTIVGLALGHIFSTRKQEWLAKTFRVPLKAIERKKRRCRN